MGQVRRQWVRQVIPRVPVDFVEDGAVIGGCEAIGWDYNVRVGFAGVWGGAGLGGAWGWAWGTAYIRS